MITLLSKAPQDRPSYPPSDPATSVEIAELSSGEEGDWDRFVTASPSGTFFHRSTWKSIVERTLGHRCFFLVARREGTISGVFPVAWVRNRLFGDCLVSLPIAVYGG